jgi:adenine-specific DNA-methyltransferase
MPTLPFKGKTFVQNHHLAVKYHQLLPKKELSFTDPANYGSGKQRLFFAPAKHVDDYNLLEYLIDFYQLP